MNKTKKIIRLNENGAVDHESKVSTSRYLIWAISQGNLERVKFYIENGGDLSEKADENYKFPNCSAAVVAYGCDEFKIGEYLLENGAALSVDEQIYLERFMNGQSIAELPYACRLKSEMRKLLKKYGYLCIGKLNDKVDEFIEMYVMKNHKSKTMESLVSFFEDCLKFISESKQMNVFEVLKMMAKELVIC